MTSPTDATDEQVAQFAPRVADTAGAVCQLVVRWKGTPPADGWKADVKLGAAMLGARLWRRRNSPGGVETFGPEGATYVSRTDPDVAMLLGIGSYAPPVAG